MIPLIKGQRKSNYDYRDNLPVNMTAVVSQIEGDTGYLLAQTVGRKGVVVKYIVIEVKEDDLHEVLGDVQQACMRRNPLDEPFIKEFESKSELVEWHSEYGLSA